MSTIGACSGRSTAIGCGSKVTATTCSMAVLRPEHAPQMLTDVESRAVLLRDAGVDVTTQRWDGMIHGFFGLGAVIVWIYVSALTVGTVRKLFDRSSVVSRRSEAANPESRTGL